MQTSNDKFRRRIDLVPPPAKIVQQSQVPKYVPRADWFSLYLIFGKSLKRFLLPARPEDKRKLVFKLVSDERNP